MVESENRIDFYGFECSSPQDKLAGAIGAVAGLCIKSCLEHGQETSFNSLGDHSRMVVKEIAAAGIGAMAGVTLSYATRYTMWSSDRAAWRELAKYIDSLETLAPSDYN